MISLFCYALLARIAGLASGVAKAWTLEEDIIRRKGLRRASLLGQRTPGLAASPVLRGVSNRIGDAIVSLRSACAACRSRIVQRIERSHDASRDTFFAESVDLRELEHRIHYYERTGLTHY